MLRPYKWSLAFMRSIPNFVRISYFSQVCCESCPSHPALFNHSNNTNFPHPSVTYSLLGLHFFLWSNIFASRDSSVGIATRSGLDGPGIEIRWGRDFPQPSRPPSLLYNGYRVSFPGAKRPARGVDDPLPSSAEVKERVELYL